MKKLFAVMLTLCLTLCSVAAVAETYSAKAKVSKIEEKEAVIILNGLEYRVLKGELEDGNEVSLVMWDMKTVSKMDDAVISAMCGMHVIHVEMLGSVPSSRTTAAK